MFAKVALVILYNVAMNNTAKLQQENNLLRE